MATYYDICETGYDGSVWELLNFEGYTSKVFDYTDNRTRLYGNTVQTGKYLLNTSNCALYHISSIITYNGYRRIQAAQHVYYLATNENELTMTNVASKRVIGTNTWDVTWTNPSGITDEHNPRKVFKIYFSIYLQGKVTSCSPWLTKTKGVSEKADRRYDAGAIWRIPSGANRITYQTGAKFMPNKLTVRIEQSDTDRLQRKARLIVYMIDTSTETKELVDDSIVTFDSRNDGTIRSVKIQGAYVQSGDLDDVFGRTAKSTQMGFDLQLPPKPEISELEYEKDTGLVSCTIKNADDTGFAHRDHVDYNISITKASGEVVYSQTRSSNELTYDFSFDIADRFAFAVGDALIFSLKATAVGFAGVSESERRMVFGIASPPSVGAASLNGGRVFMPITIDEASQADDEGVPITGIKLQLLRSVALYTEASATASEDWADTNISDNDQCTGLSIPVEDVTPSAGNATWLRVKYWTHDESIFYSYTRPVRLTFLEIPAPTAADDEVTILSVRATGEETDVEVHVAWDVAGTDDATHTEVSWSDRENAWKSTDQPKSFTASDQVWDEGQVTSGNKTYHGSTHVVISGMDAGKTYFIRARRVLIPESSQEGTTTYGPYTPSRSVGIGMGEVTGSVVLYGPRGIDEGNDLTLNWILASDERQLYYRVILTNTALNDVVLVSANSASTKCTIPWERIRPYHEEYGDLTLVVAVGTESIAATSASINVKIYPKATLSMSVSETQRVQPIRVSLASDRNDMPVSIVINSQNAVDDGMLGSDSVTVADATVYDDVVTPSWTIASEYVTQDLEEAHEALEQAREDYDAAYATLVEARDAYYTAVSTHKTLEDILASMSQDDEGYDDMVQAVADAAQAVEDALDAYEAVDISTESAAYESAISDYADAEADALTASLDALPFVAEVDVTTTTKLIDGGRYEILACGSDPSGNAISDVQTATFDVAWSHKAPMPWDEVTLTPVGDVSGNDFGAYVDIQLGEPAGAFESDVYDVYRVSGSYVARIARDVPQNASVRDQFAPFGSDSLTYRVACRTISGDVAWRDYDYSLLPQGPTDGMLLVVDWDGKRLEFDRCIDTSDAYGKGGNLRVHLDGSRSMYWREGVSRTGSYGAALLRSYDADAEGLLDELARYSGPCLVRTSDGSAYQADVVVSNVAKTHDSAKLSVQLQTTEMDGDDTFGATVTEGE